MAPPGGRYASACSLAAKVRTKPSFDSGWDASECRLREQAVNPDDCQQLQGAEVLSCEEMIERGTTEPYFVFGGPALQSVIALSGLSNLSTTSSSSDRSGGTAFQTP